MNSSSNNNMNSSNMLYSDLLFSWENSNNIYEDPLSTSSTINSSVLFNEYLLSTNNNSQQQQQLFTYNNDNAFYDLFPQEKQQLIINNNNTEPSSSQMLLHKDIFYNNHSSIVEPFTDNSIQPEIVVQKKNSSNKRKKLSIEDEQKTIQGKKKPKKKKKKRVDVDPNAPPKPKRITGLNKPLLLSNSLQIIMDGATELSRPEIVKKLWNYIKSNQLQDPADRRFILCDEKLKMIFQKDRVNSFGMNRDLSAHLTKKEGIFNNQDDISVTEHLITNNDIVPCSMIINTSMMEDFSPVPTAETPDIMTPSDSEMFLQKWSSSF